ncbi:MAG: allophanate hydrolase subunit 1 [Cyclobacteriaceae bacterium]
MQQSLQFNNVSWELFHLGEKTLLLEGPRNIPIEKVHESASLISKVLGKKLQDIVPSYTSIALFHSSNVDELLTTLTAEKNLKTDTSGAVENVQIPICYEMGLDLKEVAVHAELSENAVIDMHLKGRYKAILIGFTPGFIYMDGLDERLECPRKSNPRKLLEPGSIGIGGEQTGIYSLASPGGWNIIGRTPLQIFDAKRQPPMNIKVGSEISYNRITKKEFESWGS